MTETAAPAAPDYERLALDQLKSAEFFRTCLAQVAEEEDGCDPAMVAALDVGVRYALDAAQTYATLATLQTHRDDLVARVERLEARR